MKNLAKWSAVVTLFAAGMAISCTHSAKSPAVSANVRQGLDQAGLKKISVSEDRDNGVVTALTGEPEAMKAMGVKMISLGSDNLFLMAGMKAALSKR